MRCDFADSLLHAYFDGELNAFRTTEFERHLRLCADCGAELVTQDILSGRLQAAQLYESAPTSLRRKIRANIPEVAAATAASKPRIWHWLAAAAALLLVALVGWRISPDPGGDNYQAEFAEEIVEAHAHSLQPGHITGIPSNDEQAVKQWFDGKVKFALPIHDFANDGFALQGGRLDIVDGRTVAALVYERRGHLINVFMWPTRELDGSPRTGSRQGYRWVDWRKGKVEFCAVSDADPPDLEHLHQLIKSSA
ncbi:MAG TPA: zf-HC2 domain-containing protein [Candidatus Acidoferrum sp.]|nr:zf-HC2 domain-containing protein [Candidatus Acidoferrum sp.]